MGYGSSSKNNIWNQESESHDFPKKCTCLSAKKRRHLSFKQIMDIPPGPSGPSCSHSATVTNHIRSQRLHQGSHIIHKGHLNSINIHRIDEWITTSQGGISHSHHPIPKKSRLIVIIEFLDVWQPWVDPKRTARLILRLRMTRQSCRLYNIAYILGWEVVYPIKRTELSLHHSWFRIFAYFLP